MGKFTEYIGSQFGNPRGFVGKVCCIIMNIINKKMYKNTIALVNIESGQSVLDIGYGNGYLLKCLDRKFSPELYGIDISEDMLTEATKHNKRANKARRLHLEIGDCCDLKYEDSKFASVTSINTVYFWSDTVKGLSEIKRVLLPGGSFINMVYTKEWLDALSYTKKGFKKFDPEELMELGRKAGFSDIRVEEIVKGKSFAVVYTRDK